MIDLELDEQNSVLSKQGAGSAERFLRVNEVVEPHVGIIGKLRMRIEQSEKNEIVTRGGALHERARIGQVRGNARIIIRMLRVSAPPKLENLRIDFHRIDSATLVAQSGRNVIARARPHNQHARVRRSKTKRQIVGILIRSLLLQMGMPVQ